MTVGLSTTGVANPWLNVIGNKTTFTAPAGTFVEMHVGDPGAAGTANPSAVTARSAATFAAASAGAIALTGTNPSFTASATETITHIAVWSASSAGTFLWSAALTTPQPVVATNVVTFTAVGVAVAPLAA